MTDEHEELIILAEKALQKLQPIGWNPLDSDADWAIMCDQLEIATRYNSALARVYALGDIYDNCGSFLQECEVFEPYGTDKAAARRLASLKVAAEIGKRNG